MALLDHDTFVDLVSSTSLKSRAYQRTMETFEAVDRLEEITRTGDQVLTLARSGKLPRVQAEELLRDLTLCFTEPLEQTTKLDDVKHIVQEM